MKQVIAFAALSLTVVFTGFAQSKDLKGPNYKNAKISKRYTGNSSILIQDNPTQFKGTERKNFKPKKYQIDVIDVQEIQLPNIDIVASTENKVYSSNSEKKQSSIKECRQKICKVKTPKA